MKEEYKVKTREEIIAKATSLNLVVFWPEENELCLDMDCTTSNPNMEINPRVSAALFENGVIEPDSMFETKSAGGNKHLYFRLKHPWTDEQRLLMQACLGSDPLKEVLNILGEPLAMFETPAEAIMLKAWRDKQRGQ